MKRKVWIINQDILDRYAQGQTCQRIADVYGVSRNTIVRALSISGIKMKNPRRTWSRDEERLLMRLAGEGHDRNEIANIMGRSWSSVDSKLQRLGSVNNPELYMRRRGVDYRSEAA